MRVHKGFKGTKEKPTIVPSMFEERLVGCLCKYTHICHIVYWRLSCGVPLLESILGNHN